MTLVSLPAAIARAAGRLRWTIRLRRGRCVICAVPARGSGLCAEHGGLPLGEWTPEQRARLFDAIRAVDDEDGGLRP